MGWWPQGPLAWSLVSVPVAGLFRLPLPPCWVRRGWELRGDAPLEVAHLFHPVSWIHQVPSSGHLPWSVQMAARLLGELSLVDPVALSAISAPGPDAQLGSMLHFVKVVTGFMATAFTTEPCPRAAQPLVGVKVCAHGGRLCTGAL